MTKNQVITMKRSRQWIEGRELIEALPSPARSCVLAYATGHDSDEIEFIEFCRLLLTHMNINRLGLMLSMDDGGNWRYPGMLIDFNKSRGRCWVMCSAVRYYAETEDLGLDMFPVCYSVLMQSRQVLLDYDMWYTTTVTRLAREALVTYPETARVRVANPMAALPSDVLGRLDTRRKAREFIKTCNWKRVLNYALQAEFFRWMLLGQFVEAGNSTIVDMVARQYKLGTALLGYVQMVFEFCALCVGAIVMIPHWVASQCSEEVTAAIELSAIVAAFYCTYVVLRWTVLGVRKVIGLIFTKYVLRKSHDPKETKYLAKRLTEHGAMHEVIIEGKLFCLPALPTDTTGCREDEMALPGSTLFPSKAKNLGAILVATAGAELTIVGCFFRVDDYLISARHVTNAVSSGVAKVFAAGIKSNKKDIYYVDMSNMVELDSDYFELGNSAIQANYDVFARKMAKKHWAKLGVGEASVKKDSSYNQTVSACGFMGQDGLLMTSSGKTLPGSGLEELWHTASTHPGFSGSPLLAGNSVIGMHVAAAGDKNVALRIELIKMWLSVVPESNIPDIVLREHDYKDFDGRSWRSEDMTYDDDHMGYISTSGRVRLGYTRDDVDEMLRHRDNPRVAHDLDQMMDQAERTLTARQFKKLARYVGESNAAANGEAQCGVVEYETQRPVHSPHSPSVNKAVADLISEQAGKLAQMGFEEGKYSYPDITPSLEASSLVKHLELYSDRCAAVQSEPSEDEFRRVVRVVSEMMKHNKYEPEVGYKSLGHILDVIDSSAFKDSKSPGHPYQGNGITTNAQVLEKYTKGGFAELVLQMWDDVEVMLKTFIKADPTKKSKIDAGMPRIIAGMPAHKTIKNNCVFENFMTSLVDNWKRSPIKLNFNPQRPGDIAHLAEVFKSKKVGDSDKKNWDYNFLEWLFRMVEQVTVELAERPDLMSEEEFSEYIRDVRSCFSEVVTHAKYRCSNGKVFGHERGGIMKSGWFMTIAANSIGQLCLHVLVMIRMGYSNEQIMSGDFAIAAGGDDVLQTFPDEFDVGEYKNQMSRAGFEVTDFRVNAGFNGCEFFSHTYHLRDGVWVYLPTRFTKHVEHLKHIKHGDLASSLSSYMLNHVWDNKKFKFFDDLYRRLRRDDPESFPLALLKSQRALQYKVLGLESSSF
jgi:hypothetical protein